VTHVNPPPSLVELLLQVAAGYRMPISTDLPPALQSLLRDCWASSPDQRPRWVTLLPLLETLPALLHTPCVAPLLGRSQRTLQAPDLTLEPSRCPAVLQHG